MTIRAPPLTGLYSASSPTSSLQASFNRLVIVRKPPQSSFFNGGVGSLKLGLQIAHSDRCRFRGDFVVRANLFDRFARVVKSYANAVLSSFEDPEKILEQTVLEMNDDSTKMRQATAQVSMVTTDSGLQYKDIKVGKGPSPPTGFQVAANYVAMVPSGQIFDSSLEEGLPYIFRVGAGQVIKGLDEGIMSMKTGGKHRLYIPGPLAFQKGLNSAPGRPRVAANSPVIFDMSLEYIPGLEADEEE